MKTNTSMRVAVLLMALVLMTSCFVSGTFAKYTTTYTADDGARVAYWGFDNTNDTLSISDLFVSSYVDGNGAVSASTDVIAPGTSKSITLHLVNVSGDAPEVKYKLELNVLANSCSAGIKGNPSITWQWKLGSAAQVSGSWDDMITALNTYEQHFAANEKPDDDDKITIGWNWEFNGNDPGDTALGNDISNNNVSIEIQVIASQEQ